MSTRNLTMVINRKYASESELGFAQNPTHLSDNSCVNMYLHHDGYPEWQGVQLANWVQANNFQDGTRIAAKLVHDMYYDSCYLYPEADQIDHQYTYVIWTGERNDIWISCYNQYTNTCEFVLKPHKVISKHMGDMDYTDFANGGTRYLQDKAIDIADEDSWEEKFKLVNRKYHGALRMLSEIRDITKTV